jgi:anti-sigma regulatory factor (Ser/Thr protein kinase)
MGEGPAILCVGVEAGDLAGLRTEMPDHELVAAEGSSDAVECLRRREQGIALVLVGDSPVGGETDELVVFLRGTFPEVILGVVHPVSPEDRRRLRALGVSHFLEPPVGRGDVEPVLKRALDLRRRRAAQSDWSVTVNKGDWIEITVPSRHEYVSRIQDLIDLLERSKLAQDIRDELMLAIDELVQNAIEWGNRYDEDKRVRVSYYCPGDRVMLKVEDEGEGFSASALGDPTEDLERHMASRADAGKRPGGFGIHLIRNLVDEVVHNDRGNIVMLTKYLERQED